MTKLFHLRVLRVYLLVQLSQTWTKLRMWLRGLKMRVSVTAVFAKLLYEGREKYTGDQGL